MSSVKAVSFRRWAAALAAISMLSLAATAEAKKKHKKHKTSSSKSAGKPEPEEAEPEEAPSGGKAGGQGGEEETKAPAVKTEGGEAGGPPGEKPSGEEGAAVRAPSKKHGAAAEPEAEGAFALPAFDAVIGGGALFRHLSWNQDVTNSFAPYSLSPGPELRIGLEVYPAAFSSDGFLANIGLYGGFNYGIGVTSKTSNGTQLTTKFQDFLAGIKVRIPFGTVVPYAAFAYGAQTFRLDGQSPITVPGVAYSFVRPGIGVRAWFTPTIDLDAGAGFIYVLNLGTGAGDIASTPLLPNATAYAIDVGVSLGFRVYGPLAIRVGGDLRQYGISGNSKTSDAVRVGGAADRYITAWGGLEVQLGGVAGGAAEEEAKPADAPAPKAKRRREAEPELNDEGAE